MREPRRNSVTGPTTLLLAVGTQGSVLAERAPGRQQPFSYDPYGHSPAHQPRSSRLAFNGEFREPQGWYHLGQGHRLYNPVLRRFNRPDRLSPFGKGGLNAYAYCQGDPVNFTDPTGRVVAAINNVVTFATAFLYDLPIPSLVLTAGLLVLNVATVFNATPVGIAATVAYFSGLTGATLGVTGASMQIAGVQEDGRWVSIAGTSFSSISIAIKAGVSVNTIKQNWPTYRKEWRHRLGGVFMPWKYKSVAPSPTSQPAAPQPPSPPSPVPQPPPPRPSTPLNDIMERNPPNLGSSSQTPLTETTAFRRWKIRLRSREPQIRETRL